MKLFKKNTSGDVHNKMLIETKKILESNYDYLYNQSTFPEKAYLLRPDKIFASSYENYNNGEIRIVIYFKKNFSGYVTRDVRMHYEIIVKGSLLCKEVSSIQELPYKNESSIKKSLFSNKKKISFPIQMIKNVEIVCKKYLLKKLMIM